MYAPFSTVRHGSAIFTTFTGAGAEDGTPSTLAIPVGTLTFTGAGATVVTVFAPQFIFFFIASPVCDELSTFPDERTWPLSIS